MKEERMELDKWAEGKLLVGSMFGQGIVMMADGMIRLAEAVRERATLGDRKIVPDSEHWFRMYEENDLALRGVCSLCLAGEWNNAA
jgi:hypothetical protein